MRTEGDQDCSKDATAQPFETSTIMGDVKPEGEW